MTRVFVGLLCALVLGVVAGAVPVRAQAPVQVTVERFDPALDDIIDTTVTLEFIRQDYFGAAEGPVWIRQGGYLLFEDMGGNRIYKWDPAAKQLSSFMEKSGYTGTDTTQVNAIYNGRLMVPVLGSNGMAVDHEGRLVFCTHGDRSIVRIEKDATRTTLASRFEGKRFNGPNDLAIRSDGSIYFTDFGAALRGGADKSPDRELDFRGVFRWKPDGTVQVVARTLSNGIAFSPDEKYAYTTGGGAGGGVMVHEVQPDGSFANPRKFVENTADGIKVDRRGFVYGSHGWIASPAGKVIGIIRLPAGDNPTNVAFGDPDGRGLYVTTLRSVYHLRLKQPGW